MVLVLVKIGGSNACYIESREEKVLAHLSSRPRDGEPVLVGEDAGPRFSRSVRIVLLFEASLF